MLLTITLTHHPAADLGYLPHKNPARMQSFALAFGNAHVFYSEANEQPCTAALLLDIAPVGLVRGNRGAASGHALEPGTWNNWQQSTGRTKPFCSPCLAR